MADVPLLTHEELHEVEHELEKIHVAIGDETVSVPDSFASFGVDPEGLFEHATSIAVQSGDILAAAAWQGGVELGLALAQRIAEKRAAAGQDGRAVTVVNNFAPPPADPHAH